MQEFCFVFPNKRSATFFRYFLSESAPVGKPFVEPEITTVSDFIGDFSEHVIASRYELLFTLYKIYSELSPDIEEFDKFVFWGDMLLSDFNDVDRYMADAGQLFRNLKNYKEINSDYLTPEQKAIINRYWGQQFPLDDIGRFWTHIDRPGDPQTNRESFMKLWELLEPIYRKFRSTLSERGICYSGMQYREVAEHFNSIEAADIPYKRIIMVGFNVLSISELSIFSRLQDLNVADFYWDYSFPEPLRTDNMATHFIARYVKLFPSRYDINEKESVVLPQIDIVGIPSNVGQVKYTGLLLDKMVSEGKISDPANAIDTAIVLPSEDLFIELIHSIPQSIPTVNITMGYPMKLTPMAALLHSIIGLHLKARRTRGEWCFFYEDICDVLANPLMARIAPESCEAIRSDIERNRLFAVPAKYLQSEWPEVAPVFYQVEDLHSETDVFSYTLRLVEYLESSLKALRPQSAPLPSEEEEINTLFDDLPDDDEEVNTTDSLTLEIGFLSRYRHSVEQLRDTAARYGIAMREATFFHLIRSAIDSETISFTGEPLKGLQVMGVLETRALNFDNLIILSMNERIFPKRQYTRSFIPNILRRCFGLATMEFQECIFAYYFYRMVAASRHVTLLYDTRTEALNSGDMSRYLYQLRHHYPRKLLSMTQAAFDLPDLRELPQISITKDDKMMELINAYRRTAGEGRKFLSPTAINTYLSCPLKFCLQYLRGLREENEIVDYMDESTFGKVLHQVAEYSYNRLRGSAPSVTVTKQMLEQMSQNDIALEQLITSAINQHFHKLPSTAPQDAPEYVNNTPLIGEARVLADIMHSQMKMLFKLEQARAPFDFISAERQFAVSMPLSNTLSINLKGVIDRVDRRDGNLEVIDYKTGGDEISVSNLIHLFEPSSSYKSHHKAILQLFLYCNALRIEDKYTGPIKPWLFRFRQFNHDQAIPGVVMCKEPLNDYRPYNEKVIEALEKRLSNLFDPEKPFTPSPHPSHCKYCQFKFICNQGL